MIIPKASTCRLSSIAAKRSQSRPSRRKRESLPPDRTYPELLRRFRAHLGRVGSDPGYWAAAYRPRYHRLDQGEMRRVPIEWNANVMHEALLDGPPRTIWLSRSFSDGYYEGNVMQLPGASVDRTNDPVMLGFSSNAVGEGASQSAPD